MKQTEDFLAPEGDQNMMEGELFEIFEWECLFFIANMDFSEQYSLMWSSVHIMFITDDAIINKEKKVKDT